MKKIISILFLVGLFSASDPANACLHVLSGQTDAVSGNSVGTFDVFPIVGGGGWCSTAGDQDSPAGCLGTCGTATCQKPFQLIQCNGYPPSPVPSSSSAPAGLCEIDPLDPNLGTGCSCKAGYSIAPLAPSSVPSPSPVVVVTSAPTVTPPTTTPPSPGPCTSSTDPLICGSNTMNTCWRTQKTYKCGSGSTHPGLIYQGKEDCACPGQYQYPNPMCGMHCPLGV